MIGWIALFIVASMGMGVSAVGLYSGMRELRGNWNGRTPSENDPIGEGFLGYVFSPADDGHRDLRRRVVRCIAWLGVVAVVARIALSRIPVPSGW